jgi:hypothetical protein
MVDFFIAVALDSATPLLHSMERSTATSEESSMSHVAKLSIAVGLAFAAAALNAWWLRAEKTPPTFAAAASDIMAGKEITESMLTSVPVPGNLSKLKESLVPYANRATLFGIKAPRNYVRGDVFFQRDIQAPNDPTQFDVVGPFRLVYVGGREKQSEAEKADGGGDSGGDNVTIAVDPNFDEQTRRLLEIIDPNRRPGRDALGKIVAVQVIPEGETASLRAADTKNYVLQTVSLQGVENVQRVLLREGALIRFVIPASTSL